MLADRQSDTQTDRQADRNTTLPYRGGVTIPGVSKENKLCLHRRHAASSQEIFMLLSSCSDDIKFQLRNTTHRRPDYRCVKRTKITINVNKRVYYEKNDKGSQTLIINVEIFFKR